MSVTSTPRDDGFGGQLQNIIWDILYVKEYLHKEYVITLPTKMEHNYSNEPNFVQNLFDFMNLRKLFKINSEVEGEIQILKIGESYDILQKENNLSIFLKSNTMNELRTTFFEGKKPPYNPEFFNIALHIRHPNPHDHYPVFIKDNEFQILFERLNREYPSENVRFHIYSQGPKESLLFLDSPKTIFHIDETIQDTFLGFVYADVLTISKSSFSYLAAHYNKNKVYAFPFYHKLSDEWVVIE